jgi:cell division protein FtsB
MAKRRAQWTFRDFFIAALLLALLVWLIFLNVGIFHKEQIAQSAAHDTSVQLKGLDTRQQTLEENVNELATERGQEATLRQTYGVVRPGEGEIIVVPPTATTTPPKTFWQKYFGWLKFW